MPDFRHLMYAHFCDVFYRLPVDVGNQDDGDGGWRSQGSEKKIVPGDFPDPEKRRDFPEPLNRSVFTRVPYGDI